MIKKHLLEGVKKGAFDEAEANRRFEEWMKQNESKIEAKKANLEKSQDDQLGQRLIVEKRINEARAAKLAKRNADLAARAAAGDKADAIEEEAATAEESVQTEEAVEVDAEVTAEETAAVEEETIVDEPLASEDAVAEEEKPQE
jgi:small subunit ribosomal protein S16